MRLLYIHSYQSLIWNKVVSRRIKEWGMELREGDLVYADKSKIYLNREGNNTVCHDTDLTELNDEDEIDESKNDDTEKKDDDTANDDDTEEEMTKYKALAKPLTKEDIESEQYSIHDLVLPLPGFDILYPSNETEKWYVELLAEDGLTLDSFKNKVKLYSLPGDYRPVIIKPEAVKWHTVEYKSPTETLILSDLEELTGKTLEDLNTPKPIPAAVKEESKDEKVTTTATTAANSGDGIAADETATVEEIPPVGGKAILLEFNLPSSCYATMVLREVLKIDTSVANQIKLSIESDAAIAAAAAANKRKLDDNDTVAEEHEDDEVKKLKEE